MLVGLRAQEFCVDELPPDDRERYCSGGRMGYKRIGREKAQKAQKSECYSFFLRFLRLFAAIHLFSIPQSAQYRRRDHGAFA